MPTHIELTQSQYQALLNQMQAAYPLEACGLLAGRENKVAHLYPISNIRKSPVEYEMDPTEQLAAMMDLEDRGWELIGIYHSHPHGPQVPSPTDVAQAYYPEAAYIIVSLSGQHDPGVRAFTITSGEVGEIPIRVA